MKDLADRLCETCKTDTPLATGLEEIELHQSVSEWTVVTVDNVKRLNRAYLFKDFAEALIFTIKVGTIAEEAGHHPSLTTEYGSVAVSWWTHAISGLHVNDFIMAAKTDKLFNTCG